MKFDSDRALEENTMIQYFWKGLKFLVKVQIEQHSRELDSFKKIIKKAFDVETKIIFILCSYTYETDQYCAQSSSLALTKLYT